MSKARRKNFTELEKQWIRENFSKYCSIAEIQEEFIKHFPFRSVGSIKCLCGQKLNLHMINTRGRYGEREKEQLPIGTERIVQGVVYVKVKNVPKESKGLVVNGRTPPYWLPKHRKVWEDYHGEVPKGSFVVFLDQNRRNFNIDNLYCIERSIVGIMNKNKWFTSNRENTLAAIKYCELMQLLKWRKS